MVLKGLAEDLIKLLFVKNFCCYISKLFWKKIMEQYITDDSGTLFKSPFHYITLGVLR